MFFSDSGGYTRVDTSAALELISQDKVESARVVNNERLELTLKEGVTYSDGAKVKDATKVDDEQALTKADESKLCRYYGLQYAGAVDPSADGCEDMTDVRPAG